jgi:hypothetical protein
MGKTIPMSFRFDEQLLNDFRAIAKERGHTMTWYLESCMREIVAGRRRKERAQLKRRSSPSEKHSGHE